VIRTVLPNWRKYTIRIVLACCFGHCVLVLPAQKLEDGVLLLRMDFDFWPGMREKLQLIRMGESSLPFNASKRRI
jgi:hypothetical protein